MRVAFREKPYDLLAVVATSLAALAVAAASDVGPLRFVLGFALVLFLPGYSMVAAVFPRNGEVGWIERAALSFGLSIATVPLVGLLLDASPWGVRLESAVAALLVVTLGTTAVAYWRRVRVPPEERLALSLEFAPPRWRGLSPFDKALTIGVIVSLSLAAGGLAYAHGTPPARAGFTEFYLLAPNGGINPEDYPLRVNASEPAAVIIGIANHENREMNYTVSIQLVNVQYVYNGTTKRNDTVELGNATLDVLQVTVPNAERWESRYGFRIPSPGEYQLRFLLFTSPPQGLPYRFVQLRIHVD